MEPKDYIQRMCELSQTKLTLIEKIYKLTERQKEALVADLLDRADALINERQLIMDDVDKIDEQFVVYSSRLKSVLSLKSFEDLPRHNIPGTRELKEYVDNIHQMLGKIKCLEDENSLYVKNELKETSDKINQTKTFKRVQGAYSPVNNNVPSYFFDKKK